MAQAHEYAQSNEGLDLVYKFINTVGLTHPLATVRAGEIQAWVAEGAYDRIIRGEYIRRGTPEADRPIREHAKEARDYYKEQAKEAAQHVTAAAKEAGNMVDLDSNPTKLIEIVEIGKQLLMTRGALTTFSIANDVAKYFAIIPAMFILAFPQLGVLNVMHLATPESAILSAVIFNAVIIIGLIPLALKGIPYTPLGAAALLRRNLLIYGLGGVVLPFVGIKAIDVVLTATGLA